MGACMVLLAVSLGGVADARDERTDALRERVEGYDVRLEERLREVTAAGERLEEAQARVDEASARSRAIAEQKDALERDLAAQSQAHDSARQAYEARAAAIYRGSGQTGMLLLLEGVLGTREGLGSSVVAGAAEALMGAREEIDAYADAQEELENTIRQLDQKRGQYSAVQAETRARGAELEAEEAALERTVGEIREDRGRVEDRIEELEAAEKERIQRRRAATRVAVAEREEASEEMVREARIAREDLVVEEVDLPLDSYMKLYKKAAADYGFAGDWYVLAAVGQIESGHGTSMGPSSAGALGPMQFLPSTWKYAGVDGNGDGEANIMDPRDAIPAAARYLQAGGAPGDWSAALYSYNHAEWYVDEVLAIAEAYRQAEGDSRTAPYV